MKRETVFEVVVGNIGTVYRGPLLKEALMAFGEYSRQSREGYGRASGEPVTLFKDGEEFRSHEGEDR